MSQIVMPDGIGKEDTLEQRPDLHAKLPYQSGVVLVMFKNKTTLEEALALLEEHKISALEHSKDYFNLTHMLLVSVGPGKEQIWISHLMADHAGTKGPVWLAELNHQNHMIDKEIPVSINQLPQHAPHSLSVKIIDGISFDEAKRVLESLGLAVSNGDLLWENFSVITVVIPSGELDGWMEQLRSQKIVCRVEKVALRYALN